MKKLTSLATIISLVLAAPGAQASLVFEDYAKVTNVTPQYEKVNLPRKECFSEYVPEREHRHGSLAGPLIGGIAGGILGAQVGKGTGRVAVHTGKAVRSPRAAPSEIPGNFPGREINPHMLGFKGFAVVRHTGTHGEAFVAKRNADIRYSQPRVRID